MPLTFQHTIVVSGHQHPNLDVLVAEVQEMFPDYKVAVRDVDYYSIQNTHAVILDLSKRIDEP